MSSKFLTLKYMSQIKLVKSLLNKNHNLFNHIPSTFRYHFYVLYLHLKYVQYKGCDDIIHLLEMRCYFWKMCDVISGDGVMIKLR